MVMLQKEITALDRHAEIGSLLPNLNEHKKAVHFFKNSHDKSGGSQSMKRRLPNIVHNAGSLRGLANQYRDEARLALHKARRARLRGDENEFLTHMQAVRTARYKASKCSSFANLCERRAKTIDKLIQPAMSSR